MVRKTQGLCQGSLTWLCRQNVLQDLVPVFDIRSATRHFCLTVGSECLMYAFHCVVSSEHRRAEEG